MAPPVLLTRPEQASLKLAEALRRAGARVVVSPLLSIHPASRLPELAAALLMTSRNAVSVYRRLGGPAGLPVWCVGPGTAEMAASAGLSVQSVAPTAEALADMVPDGAPPLLHLRGAVQRGDLVARLRARGLVANDAVIYDQVPCPLSAEALDLLAAQAIVPLYSPRTATLFVAACPDACWPNLDVIAMSEAVAEVLPQCATIAASPDGRAMQQAILERFTGSAVEGRAG